MKLFLFFLISILSTNILASDGSSGCGPGWYLFKENSLISSVLRATTNTILFPSSTLGMTLGTSNCTKHKIVQNEKRSLHYATHNFYELKSEIPMGTGLFLTAFHQVLGCQDSSKDYFKRTLKMKFEQLFPSNSPQHLLKKVYQIILSDQKLVRSCSLS